MRSLALQNRLLLALVVAGVVPVIVFATVAFLLAGGSVASRQATDLASLTGLAASQVGGAPLDVSTAGRLDALTDRTATLFSKGGQVLASSDRSDPVPPPPSGLTAGTALTTRTAGGQVIAYAALPSGSASWR